MTRSPIETLQRIRHICAMTVYTIGHSTRSLEELIDLLRGAKIDLVVDVRSYPRSRRNPQFNDDVLSKALRDAGIGYRHQKALGGRRGAQALGRPSPNGFWENMPFRNYADYALTPPFGEALADLVGLAGRQTVAIMCAEAVWWRCHRRIIADYLLAAGHDVRHILGPGQVEPARMTPEAATQPDGRIHYPAAQPFLL